MANAEATLRAAGFTTSVGAAVNSRYPKGVVAGSSPAGGSQAGSGTQVVLYPSTGHKPKKDRGRDRDRDGNRGHGGGDGGFDDD